MSNPFVIWLASLFGGSKSARAAAAAKHFPPAGQKAPAAGPSSPVAAAPSTPRGDTPYDHAKSWIGCREIPGAKDNPTIMDWLRRFVGWPKTEEVPWCSAFVNAMAQDAGYEQSRSLAARSWLAVGQPIALGAAKAGDVAILWRGSPDSDTGHVGFFVRLEGNTIFLLGGNQGDAVSIAPYPAARVLGIRRLKKLRGNA